MQNPKDSEMKTNLSGNSDPAIPAPAAEEKQQMDLARGFMRENREALRELAVGRGRRGLLIVKATGRVVTPEMVKEASEDDLD
jgi:hypothetical protein